MPTYILQLTFTDTNPNLITMLKGYCRYNNYPGDYNDIAAMQAFTKATETININIQSATGQALLIRDATVIPAPILPPVT